MTTLAQLVADVVTATARSDLIATGDIALAVRRATLKLHAMAFWPRDLAEGVITFQDASLVNQSINIANNLPQFRAIKYIRECFPGQLTTAGTYNRERFYEKLEPDFILDDYGQNRDSIWYLGGSNINLRSRVVSNSGGTQTSVPAVTVGWYQYPLVADALTYNSWIADAYSFAIVDEAARMIFVNTGFMDIARTYDNIMTEHRQYMIQNFIDGEGR